MSQFLINEVTTSFDLLTVEILFRDIQWLVPLKRVTRKQRRFKKPWLTKALLKSIKRKSDLYKKYLRVPSVVNAPLYKT